LSIGNSRRLQAGVERQVTVMEFDGLWADWYANAKQK